MSGFTRRGSQRILAICARERPAAASLLLHRAMIKLKTGFGEYSADDLMHLGEEVDTNLPTIAIFNTLKPPPAEILTAVIALRAAINILGPSRAQAITAAFDSLAGLLADVAVNAPQIEGVTDIDLAAIGLPVQKARTRETQAPGMCENLRPRHGNNPGEVLAVCDPVGTNIRLYDAQFTLDPNAGTWTDAGSFPNSRAFKFTGLARGKDTWFRVRGRNTVGPGAWSDPATIMVT